jgi:hypothetical protein
MASKKILPQNVGYLHNHNLVRHSSAQHHFCTLNAYNERPRTSTANDGYSRIRHQSHRQQPAPQALTRFYGDQLDRLAGFNR